MIELRTAPAFLVLAITTLALWALPSGSMAAEIDDAADVMTQQAQEKDELQDMKRELGDIKSTMTEATKGMEQLQQKVKERANAGSREIHLIAKDAQWEIVPGVSINALTYNGSEPGPVVRLREGDNVRIYLHNQMRSATSLYLHGMQLPQSVAGLPRKDAGMVTPGQTYAFQFVAPAAGTYWYHPQVIHADQMSRGLYGAIVVDSAHAGRSYDKDFVLVLGDTQIVSRPLPGTAGGGARTYFTVNGKSAPAIAPLEVHSGERVRLRLINASSVAFPLYLTGHKLEIVSINGGDVMEPHVTRDTITLQPGDRVDADFVANNPGVWSLASVLPSQTTTDGKFPGGVAVVVRYPESLPPH